MDSGRELSRQRGWPGKRCWQRHIPASRAAWRGRVDCQLYAVPNPCARRRRPGRERCLRSRHKLPGSLSRTPLLDAWIRIDADGSATAFTGKAELGQGIETTLLQIAAEELELPVDRVKLVTADTARTANEGYTAGSHSTQDSGTALRNAAAQVREILIGEAARRWALPPEKLSAIQGVVVAPGGARLGYGELVSPTLLHVEAQPTSKLKSPSAFTAMGKSLPRVDIPAKVTGGVSYVQDLRIPGMLHARVVQPPSYGAQLTVIYASLVERLAGVVKVVRDGNFLAVIAEREYQAIRAMQMLAAAARWHENPALPKESNLAEALLGLPAEDFTIFEKPPRPAGASRSGASRSGASLPATSTGGSTTLAATYTRPYVSHASIGPSCAVAQIQGDTLTVWTHTQGVYPDRQAIAEMLHMPPDKVHCIHMQGSGRCLTVRLDEPPQRRPWNRLWFRFRALQESGRLLRRSGPTESLSRERPYRGRAHRRRRRYRPDRQS